MPAEAPAWLAKRRHGVCCSIAAQVPDLSARFAPQNTHGSRLHSYVTPRWRPLPFSEEGYLRPIDARPRPAFVSCLVGRPTVIRTPPASKSALAPSARSVCDSTALIGTGGPHSSTCASNTP